MIELGGPLGEREIPKEWGHHWEVSTLGAHQLRFFDGWHHQQSPAQPTPRPQNNVHAEAGKEVYC